MNEEQANDGHSAKRPARKKVRLGIVAVALLGLGTVIGVVATEGPGRSVWHGWKDWSHHGSGMSEERVLERAKRFSGRILDEVDASDAQRDQIDEVLDTFVANAWPLREQHREHRQALVAELTRDEVSREALEELRTRELALADALSGELMEALVAVSGILDAEQRVALAEHMSRHRRHHHHRDDH